MNLKGFKMKWLVASLTIAVISGGYPVARGHLKTQSRIHSEETLCAILDRLAQDQKLNTILKLIQAGGVEEAAQRLNFLLCENIVSVNSQLASTDNRARSFAQSAFCRMAQYRPKPSPVTGVASVRERSCEEIEAQKILALAVAADPRAYRASTVSR
jgi:hypothetical protein